MINLIGVKRALVLVLGLTVLTGCGGRYETNDFAVLKQRVQRDFPLGTPASDLVQTLTRQGYTPRDLPLNNDGRAWPANCLWTRVTGGVQLAGSRIMYVCYDADAAGNLTAINATSVTNNI